jgi:hypothetical protein
MKLFGDEDQAHKAVAEMRALFGKCELGTLYRAYCHTESEWKI